MTAQAGTDFVATFDPSLKSVRETGVVEKIGDWENLPSGEVFTAPKSLEGKLVVDGTVGEWIGIKYNGKLDYPARILSYMQDPELHALIYSERKPQLSPLI